MGDGVLAQVLQRPEALHRDLILRISGVGDVKGADDGEQLRVFGFERRDQCGGGADYEIGRASCRERV